MKQELEQARATLLAACQKVSDDLVEVEDNSPSGRLVMKIRDRVLKDPTNALLRINAALGYEKEKRAARRQKINEKGGPTVAPSKAETAAAEPTPEG